jgi:hypothetical protein
MSLIDVKRTVSDAMVDGRSVRYSRDRRRIRATAPKAGFVAISPGATGPLDAQRLRVRFGSSGRTG